MKNVVIFLFCSNYGFHYSLRNVEAATEVGIVGLHFKNADLLLQELSSMGIDISIDDPRQDQAKFAKEHS